MKTRLLKLIVASGFITIQCSLSVKGQTISTFESLALPADSFWNGSSQTLGATFSNGNAVFPNFYDTAYGGIWSSGWAYSNETDSTTSDYTDPYSARTASGYANSFNYAVGKQNSIIRLTGTASGKVVSGFYVTNATYPYLSLENGDFFARKFGDTTGTSSGLAQGTVPDWFKLTVRNWQGGTMTNDSVEFYLADFRFSNSTQDYIVKTWQWVDLSALGNVDSLEFILSSSDVGLYGMNTPAFFCIDNFTTADSPASLNTVLSENTEISIFPNPSSEGVYVNLSNIKSDNLKVSIADVTGRVLSSEMIYSHTAYLPLENYRSGIYLITVTGDNFSSTQKLIKE